MTIETILKDQSGNKCELCSSLEELEVYEISNPPQRDVDTSILLCQNCLSQIKDPSLVDTNHWHCLNDSIWSECIPVQVMSYRVLKSLNNHGWAQDLIEQMYLEDDLKEWAEAESDQSIHTIAPTKDSNGAILLEGDTVTLIKDLDVKGAGFTAKRGTIVKKIALTDNPEHIEGRVNGVKIVLLTCFLKKA